MDLDVACRPWKSQAVSDRKCPLICQRPVVGYRARSAIAPLKDLPTQLGQTLSATATPLVPSDPGAGACANAKLRRNGESKAVVRRIECRTAALPGS